MICPFKASARSGDVCGDCEKPFTPDMQCGLLAFTRLPGEPISAGVAAVCDPSDGICTSCE